MVCTVAPVSQERILLRRDRPRPYAQTVAESVHFIGAAGGAALADPKQREGARYGSKARTTARLAPAPSDHPGGGPGGGSRKGGIGGGGVGFDPGGGSRGASFGGRGIRAMRSPFVLSAGAAEPNSSVACSARPGLPATQSISGSGFFPRATVVQRGKRGLPECVRRLHDLHVMKALEANVPPVRGLRGFFEALHFRIDFGHCSSRRAGIRRCTYFETLRGTFWTRSKNIPRHCPSSSPCYEHAPHRGPFRSAVRPTHSEHLSGAKRHVR